MSHFRFIHAADIHLGSLLNIDRPNKQMSSLQERAVYDAFERLCKIGIDQDIDFLLIAGDLYDSDSKNIYANKFFIKMCNELKDKGIDLYVLAGNHDPLNQQWDYFDLPDNVKIFSADQADQYLVEREGQVLARIIGQSYKSKWESRRVYEGFDLDKDGIFNIGLLHTQLESGDKKYIPARATDLAKNEAIHYWALGHIHRPQLIRDQDPVIAYPGIPQARDFGEQDQGGAYLVEVRGTRIVKMAYLAVSSVIYKTVEIDISSRELKEAKTLNDLEDHIIAIGQSLAESQTGKWPADLEEIADNNLAQQPVEAYIIRWLIKGRGQLHKLLKDLGQEGESELAEGLRRQLAGFSPLIWTDSIQLRTGMPITRELEADYQHIIDMMDQAISGLYEDQSQQNELLDLLGRLWTRQEDPEDRDYLKFHLDDKTLKQMTDSAKQLVLEKLVDRAGDQ